MSQDRIEHALDLMRVYNIKVKEETTKIFDVLDKVADLKKDYRKLRILLRRSQIQNDLRVLKEILKNEERLENLIDKVNPSLHDYLREDTAILLRDIEIIENFILELSQLIRKLSDITYLDHLKNFIETKKQDMDTIKIDFNRIFSRDIYAEHLFQEWSELAKDVWNSRVHGKVFWLYHGTSILFLDSIKKYGLDTSKIPRGIMRAITRISKYYKDFETEHHSDTFGFINFMKYFKQAVDVITIDLSDPENTGVSLSSNIDVIDIAYTPNLPAFLYELLNEEMLTDEGRKNLFERSNEEQKHMLTVVWRFGRILRAHNKAILLGIKVDSAFLKHFKIPDFIEDFDIFLEYATKIHRTKESNFNSPWYNEKLIDQLSNPRHIINGFFTKHAFKGSEEYTFDEIPLKFIYAIIGNTKSSEFIHISKVNDKMIPLLKIVGVSER